MATRIVAAMLDDETMDGFESGHGGASRDQDLSRRRSSERRLIAGHKSNSGF
ncbi:MAG: hypothetical protein ABJE10_08655 [bacterium]